MDCVRGMQEHITDGSIDCIITSPPYDNLRAYNGYSYDFKNTANELFRVLKDGGVMVWVVGDACIDGSETGSSFRQALYFLDLGFYLHDTMIYQKNSSAYPSKRDGNRYTQIFEYMFILCKGKPQTASLLCDKPNKWAGYKRFETPTPDISPRTNIWQFNTSKNSSKHPAPFPEDLVRDHLMTWTLEGDLILDPFMGSGTTAYVSLMLGRCFIGFETSIDYCDIANDRLGLYANQ